MENNYIARLCRWLFGVLVGEFVQSGAVVAFDPDEFDRVGGVEVVEPFDEVEVFDVARFFAPAVFVPSGGPFGDGVDPELGVGVDFAGFVLCEFDGVDDSGGLHADIGGVIGVTYGDDFGFVMAEVFDDSVAAFTGIGVGAAVGPKNSHKYNDSTKCLNGKVLVARALVAGDFCEMMGKR